MSFDTLSRSQKIRATLHRDVRSMCTETCHFMGLEITKPAMEIISELVYRKMSVYGTDLEAFAKHAKRSTINSEDVKLLVRRNTSLRGHLNSIVPTPSLTTKEKRRKTVLPVTKPSEIPTTNDEPEKEQKTIEKPWSNSITDKPGSNSIKDKLCLNSHTNKPPETSMFENLVKKPDEFDEAMTIDDTIDLTFD